MKTIIYFVRHAESPYVEGADRTRGLSDNGIRNAMKIQTFLYNEIIDVFISSPYERTIQTIKPLAEHLNKNIIVIEDLRERKMGQISKLNFMEAKQRVYDDFKFSFPAGESSSEAQKRAVIQLEQILDQYKGKKIVLGTHGDIMTLMLNYFSKKYDFDFWKSTTMPDIYELKFKEKTLIEVTRQWE